MRDTYEDIIDRDLDVPEAHYGRTPPGIEKEPEDEWWVPVAVVVVLALVVLLFR